jgi:hypothetical protein
MKNMDFSQLPAAVDTNLVEAKDSANPNTSSPVSQNNDDIWVYTSLSMRKQTRNEIKMFAITHNMSMRDVIDLAAKEYLSKHHNG